MFSLSTAVVSGTCSPLPVIGPGIVPELKDVCRDWMRLRALGVPLFPS